MEEAASQALAPTLMGGWHHLFQDSISFCLPELLMALSSMFLLTPNRLL